MRRRLPIWLFPSCAILLLSPLVVDALPLALNLTSPDFGEGAYLPASQSCDAGDISPALHWNHGPYGTRSFALVLRDPDAPGRVFVHWVLYNIPAAARSLAPGVPTLAQLPDGSRQGRNSFNRIGYAGPCPPPGPAHRYTFTLYAIDTALELPSTAGEPQLMRALKGHILATSQRMGYYRR